MIQFNWINGLCFGIEYAESEDLGFVLALDLGFFRFLWFKDLVEDT